MKPATNTDSVSNADARTASAAVPHKNDDQVRASQKSDHGALWVLAGVVALTGSFVWMIRDVWLSTPVASDGRVAEVVGKGRAIADSAAVTESGASPALATPPEAETKEGVSGDGDQTGRIDALQREAERLRSERYEAERRLEQEMAARALLEQRRLEEEKRLARESVALAKQRAEAEQQLERERRARDALERKRREAEDRLAEQRAQRAELERQTRLEQERLKSARQAAIEAERERARVEARAQSTAVVDRQPEGIAQPVEAAEAFPEERVDSARTQETADAAQGGFSTNPCEGPTAKFLSTCR